MKRFVLFVIMAIMALPVLSQPPHPAVFGLIQDYFIKDTTRYYVVEIKERTECDTFRVSAPCWDERYAERGEACSVSHFKRIIKCDDTVWAAKIQVWLTPAQIEKLLEVLK